MLFPSHRVYLQRGILEPGFDDEGGLLFASAADGRTTIERIDLETGLRRTLTSEPAPSGGVCYGGGLFAPRGDALVFPTREGRLARLDTKQGGTRMLWPAVDGLGAPIVSSCGRWVACAAEHDQQGFVLIGPSSGPDWPVRLPESMGFAGDPCFGPQGSYCAWQTWSDRLMPWDHSELRIARFARPLAECSSIHEAFPVKTDAFSRPGAHLAFPIAHPDGRRLLFTSDETGWRTPWSLDLETMQAAPIADCDGEVGTPNWVQRMTPMALGQGGRVLYVVSRKMGVARILAVDLDARTLSPISSSLRSIQGFTCRDGGDEGTDVLAYVGSTPTSAPVVITRKVQGAMAGQEVVRAHTEPGPWDPAGLARAELIEWVAPDGTPVWGVWTVALAQGPAPAIVMVHGGPTSASELGYDPLAQFFATRGWHVLSVNYRGSTQAGRAYQDRLLGQWGVVDVEDALGGADALISRGAAERGRIAIMGGSAGGYTALLAVGVEPDAWAAGVSMYGISDLYETAQGAHRFERKYQDVLVGALPEAGPLWVERSPLAHVASVRAPLLLFHGQQDRAVPCAQSVRFAEAVRARGGIAELVTYEDEGHGFRREKNRKDFLQRTLAFLEKYVRDQQGR